MPKIGPIRIRNRSALSGMGWVGAQHKTCLSSVLVVNAWVSAWNECSKMCCGTWKKSSIKADRRTFVRFGSVCPYMHFVDRFRVICCFFAVGEESRGCSQMPDTSPSAQLDTSPTITNSTVLESSLSGTESLSSLNGLLDSVGEKSPDAPSSPPASSPQLPSATRARLIVLLTRCRFFAPSLFFLQISRRCSRYTNRSTLYAQRSISWCLLFENGRRSEIVFLSIFGTCVHSLPVSRRRGNDFSASFPSKMNYISANLC